MVVYTASKNHCKAVCNSSSSLLQLTSQHPDLIPSSIMVLTTQAVISGWNVISQVLAVIGAVCSPFICLHKCTALFLQLSAGLVRVICSSFSGHSGLSAHLSPRGVR